MGGYVLAYAVMVIVSTLVGWVQQVDTGWSQVGGFGTFLLSMVFWFVLFVPVLALLGVLEAVAVWLSLLFSRGSVRTGAATAGITGAALFMAFVVVYSDAPAGELVQYGVVGAVTGALAAWLTMRDLTRIPSLTGWLTGLRRRSSPASPEDVMT